MSTPNRPRRPHRGPFDDPFADDEDPTAGLVNLFDLWMVFAFALLLMLAEGTMRRATDAADVQETRPLSDRLVPTERRLDGRGTRLGTAYRLASGEVVYVPDANAGTTDGR